MNLHCCVDRTNSFSFCVFLEQAGGKARRSPRLPSSCSSNKHMEHFAENSWAMLLSHDSYVPVRGNKTILQLARFNLPWN